MSGTAIAPRIAGGTGIDVTPEGEISAVAPSGAGQDLRQTLAVDSSQAADAYAILLTQNVVLPVAQILDVTVTYAVAVSPLSIASIAIFVDGVQTQAAGSWTNGTAAQQSGAVSFRTPVALAPGAHTITTRWRNFAGAGAGILCRPVANPTLESCSMRTMVLESA